MASVEVPPERVRAAREFAALFVPGRRVALTTHVNADGDGVGSEVGLWHLLTARRLHPVIVNPTPLPDRFRFIVPEGADRSRAGQREIEHADVVAVLDIGDLGRLGELGAAVARRGVPVVCVDHHVSPGTLPAGPRMVAPEATATAELIHDLAVANAWPITADVARALYVGILMDTGGFRFANTSPRALRVAADLLEAGVDPEGIYERVYASAPEGRVRLTAEVLFDAVNQVTGSEGRFDGLPAGTRAVCLPDNSFNAGSYFLTVFGRPDSSSACECERSQEASLAQSLHLLNAKDIQEKLAAPNGRAALLAADAQRNDDEKIRELYLRAYSREPKTEELALARNHLERKVKDKDGVEAPINKREAYEDIIWALLNTKEFLFNH